MRIGKIVKTSRVSNRLIVQEFWRCLDRAPNVVTFSLSFAWNYWEEHLMVMISKVHFGFGWAVDAFDYPAGVLYPEGYDTFHIG